MYEPDRFLKREIACFLQSRLSAKHEPSSPEEAKKTGYVEVMAGPDLRQYILAAESFSLEVARQIRCAYRRDVGWRRARLDMKSLQKALGSAELARAVAFCGGFYQLEVGGDLIWVNFTDANRKPEAAIQTVIATITFDGMEWDGEEFVDHD